MFLAQGQSPGAVVSCKGSVGGESGSKLTLIVVDRIHFLTGCLTEGLVSSLADGWGLSSVSCSVDLSIG